MLAPGSIEKEYEQIVRTPFVFQQAKPALWKAPLAVSFLFCRGDGENLPPRQTLEKTLLYAYARRNNLSGARLFMRSPLSLYASAGFKVLSPLFYLF